MHAIGAVDPPTPEAAASLGDKGIELCDFDTVVENADFLTVHVPLSAATRHLVDAQVLSRMKRGSFLVNVARGGVVHEEALYKALLNGGRLAGAALDVHEHEGEGVRSPLADLPNVVLTPHIGSMAVEVQAEIGKRVLEIVEGFRCR